MLNEQLKVAFFLAVFCVCCQTCSEGQQRLYTPTKSSKLRRIQSGFRMQAKGRGSSSSLHLPLEVRRDESQIGPAALTSPELPTSQELIPFNASLPSRRFPERKSPNGKHFQHVFSICTAGCLMRRFRLRFRLSAECITAAAALSRPEPMTLCSLAAFSSC